MITSNKSALPQYPAACAIFEGWAKAPQKPLDEAEKEVIKRLETANSADLIPVYLDGLREVYRREAGKPRPRYGFTKRREK